MTNQQVSTNSSTNAKQDRRTIRPSCFLIKSSFPNVTVAEHLYSANQKPTSSLTLRITSGAQLLRRRPKARFRAIIAPLLLEVSFHHDMLYLLLLTYPNSSCETRPYPNERTPSHTRRPTDQHDQRTTKTNPQHAGTPRASKRVGSVSTLIAFFLEM